MLKFIICIICCHLITHILCSEGDRSPFFQNCLRSCARDSCTTNLVFKPEIKKQLNVYTRLLWNCQDNCQYICMWRTAEGFKDRGYDTPKFHGKWPFQRVFGVQEPASVLGSILNLISHAYMYSEIKSKFTIRAMPVVLFWHVFAWVCMHAWVWSIIFHTRDVFFTEFMDYACALSMVMSLFVAAVIRIFHRARKTTACVVAASALYYCDHVRYLYTARVDYDYNMKVNVFFGVVGSLLWLLWACGQYVGGRHYVWRLGAFTLLSGVALGLELFDFPPKYHAWDAHALWHLSTAPLPLLFYRFVIDDLSNNRTSATLDKTNIKLT